jgi:hypothetical protein
MIAGALTAWGTKAVLDRYVLYDPNDPLIKQGGLSQQQDVLKARSPVVPQN